MNLKQINVAIVGLGLSGRFIHYNLISSLNAFALAYHGYKRHGQEDQPADIQQYIWAACWGLAGFYNLTNLGVAYAIGFAKPKGTPIGSQRPEIVDANMRVEDVLTATTNPANKVANNPKKKKKKI